MDAELLALALGLFSAVTLAAANLSVKAGRDILAARAILSATSAILLLPALFFLPLPDSATWRALALAVPAHMLYQFFLINALMRGDLSLVFPVMRGSAPLLTGIAAAFLLDEVLTPAGFAGLLVAVLAVVAFAWPPKGERMRSHPDRTALMFAALTAIGIALYNVTDAAGVRAAVSPFTFIAWLFVLDAFGICAVALVRPAGAPARGDRPALAIRADGRSAIDLQLRRCALRLYAG